MSKETNLVIRVSKEEKHLIHKKAQEAGMKLSDYVRCSSLNGTKYEIISTTTKTIISEIREVK